MANQIYIEKSFFAGDSQRDTFRLGALPPGYKVDSVCLDFTLKLTKTYDSTDIQFKIDAEGSADTGMDSFITAFAANVKLAGKPGAGLLLDLPAKDLRKLHILKTGRDVPGSFTPLPCLSSIVSTTGTITITAPITIPILFANPRLADPWLLCPTTEQLSGGTLQLDWGTGNDSGKYDGFTLGTTNTFVNIRATLVPNPGGQPGPIYLARKYSCTTRSLSIDPGLVTHIFDDKLVTAAPNKELAYELDGNRIFDGATLESLAAQHETECRIDYRGPALTASATLAAANKGTIRNLLTPIRWISEGCPVEHLIASNKGERLLYSSAFDNIREVVVERYVPGCEFSK